MSDPADARRAKRITILARSNGISNGTIGVLALAISLYARDLVSVLASLGLCGGAMLEIFGSVRAARHDAMTPRFLVASQVASLLSVLGLALRCTAALSPALVLTWLPESYRETVLMLYPGPGEAEAYLRTGLRLTLGAVVLVAALFECGMAAYYASSTAVFLRLSSGKIPRHLDGDAPLQ
ncbi:MAG TPA: hypothetical protein VMM36_07645 [Opitutaceae bacterium]|nr:hypothetical protein [Opitutaceae bacterium]